MPTWETFRRKTWKMNFNKHTVNTYICYFIFIFDNFIPTYHSLHVCSHQALLCARLAACVVILVNNFRDWWNASLPAFACSARAQDPAHIAGIESPWLQGLNTHSHWSDTKWLWFFVSFFGFRLQGFPLPLSVSSCQVQWIETPQLKLQSLTNTETHKE